MPKKDVLAVGKFIGNHGLRGEIKVEYWTDTSEIFCDTKNKFIKKNNENLILNIENFRYSKNHILLKLKNVNSREESCEFVNQIIYAHRHDILIDKNSFFIEELKECSVFDFGNNKFLGVLKDVINRGASDIYVIFSDNHEYLVPIIPGTVKNVDLENNKIYISPIKGIFDDN